ncbi:protein SPT2 homolog [Daktulosphaira vitifoliae]|uniref:protein SPT2 homolog n=1 Tax=Daktulosphaira vitifoliae TaxID=58002 RepID=UPI0021AAD6DF|nr:protein SPT2 homolog [Daktulosphaira vitifoliae]
MDFNTLLYQAQKNNHKDNYVNYYKASLDPPKKETKEKKLSDNIKKFLAKKEEEEKQKKLEERRKKEELLSLRSQDRKSFKRVQSMLNRTKSANKAVIEDAKDDVNTSVTMAGHQQPDEDDYGYVSKDAMDIYNNIINKYVNTPADSRSCKVTSNKSSDISGTKDRVKAALLKEEEDQLLPHKRKRKSKDNDNGDDICSDSEPQQKKNKSDSISDQHKKRPSQPPPMNFQELLKIAEKKQHEPIIIEKKVKEETTPMMTKKEKEKYLEEKKLEAMRIARRQGKPILPSLDKSKDLKSTEKLKFPSSKIDPHAEEKLKKSSSVWAKDLKINKELNNNKNKYLPQKVSESEVRSNGKHEKYVPRQPNHSYIISNGKHEKYVPSQPNHSEIKSNGTHQKYVPQSVPEKYIPKEKKRYSSEDERYSPKPKVIMLLDEKYVPRSKNNSLDKYSPSLKYNSTSDKYVPKPKSNNKYSENSKSDKCSKPHSITFSDKHLPKSTKLNEKYVPSSKNTSVERYSPKPKSVSSHEKYVPQMQNSRSSNKYLSSTKSQSTEKYYPEPSSCSNKSIKSNPEKYIPSTIDKSKKTAYEAKPKHLPPKDKVPKQFPPRDMISKQFPPKDMIPKRFPPDDVQRRNNRSMPIRSKQLVIESDSDEYDSELDDFIDDGPEDEADYSRVISEIFKYDKNKYRGMDDDDDECMESDFRTLQKEEYRSTRAGLLEDLADIRREKMMTKKRKKL